MVKEIDYLPEPQSRIISLVCLQQLDYQVDYQQLLINHIMIDLNGIGKHK